MTQITIAGKKYNLPANRVVRIVLGIALVLGGIFGFLPILGFWMIPLGVVMLSVDSALVRKFRRRVEVAMGRWWQNRRAKRTTRRNKP